MNTLFLVMTVQSVGGILATMEKHLPLGLVDIEGLLFIINKLSS